MKKRIFFLLMIFSAKAFANLNILACTPEWASLAKELGGDRVSVNSATTALQDPHRVEARPSLIARARSADLMVCTGAELEVGWAPLLQRQSGNDRIQVGRPGYLEATSAVALIEKPALLDRSMGDVHPGGNPHVHLDPRNIEKVAIVLAERMASIDPKERTFYEKQKEKFLSRWREAMVRWDRAGAPLKGMPVVVYHKDLSYLIAWLGLKEVGSLEPKPGLPPSTAHLAELLERLKREPAKVVVRSAYNEPRAAEWLSERAKIPAVTLPYTVGGTEGAKDLFGLFDDTLARLLAVSR